MPAECPARISRARLAVAIGITAKYEKYAESRGAGSVFLGKLLLVLTFDQLPPASPRHISIQTAYEWLLEMDFPAVK